MVQQETNQSSKKCIAVLISDVHYSVQTLNLANAALEYAVGYSNTLKVPLVIAGDLHDTKALMRAECVNAIIKTITKANQNVYVLVGNHDKINEKSEEHALEFLRPYTQVIDHPQYVSNLGTHLIPYQCDVDVLRSILKKIRPGSKIIMHQGCKDAGPGEYIQDKTALAKHEYADFRVISGHYHTAQDIVCNPIATGTDGLFSYIGNPYTLGWGEAQDPPKGICLLYDDGSITRMPLPLRRHVVFETTADFPTPLPHLDRYDLLRIKVHGTRQELAALSRASVEKALGLSVLNWRLDLLPSDVFLAAPNQVPENTPQAEVLDGLIEALQGTSEAQKERLKALWKDVLA